MLQLRLTVVRCLKSIVCLNDEFYHRYLISENLYAPVMDLLRENLHEDNLANSSILDFFKIVSSQCMQALELKASDKRNFIMLNKHLVKNYRDILLEVDYVPFTKDMIRMYDEGEGQLHESVTESTSMVYAKEGKRTFSETLETTKELIDPVTGPSVLCGSRFLCTAGTGVFGVVFGRRRRLLEHAGARRRCAAQGSSAFGRGG